MRFNPTPIRKRDPQKIATTTYANEIADAVNNQTPSFIVGCEDADFAPGLMFLAKVTDAGPNGEADLTNNQFWAEPQIIVAGMVNDQATLDPLHGLTPFKIVAATNLFTNGRVLKKNAVVFVRAELDKSVPPKVRFVTCSPPTDLVMRVDLVKTGGSAGSRTAICNYTYTAKLQGTSTVIGVNLSPEYSGARAFPMKVNTPATAGLLCWISGAPTVTLAYESTGNKGCG